VVSSRTRRTTTPTRYRAVCTASACRWSTRSPNGSTSTSGATAKSIICASRIGDAVAPLKVIGPAVDENGNTKKGTRVTFLASPATFKNQIEYDFEKLEHRYRELAFLNSGVRLFLRDARHEEVKEIELYL
jgi:hypothetical protein